MYAIIAIDTTHGGVILNAKSLVEAVAIFIEAPLYEKRIMKETSIRIGENLTEVGTKYEPLSELEEMEADRIEKSIKEAKKIEEAKKKAKEIGDRLSMPCIHENTKTRNRFVERP